ncbi:MAG: hypothetical protein ABJF11_16530 [Reichenbachiella sp.]|uniref:hypothetical protein n=1 Tax=Reichenbachiella sp. TaxID=2184521 RepID=UPI003266D0F3
MTKKYIFGTLAFILITFVTQSTSHFLINADHYASIPYMRSEVIFPLGFLTMTLQGLVLTYFFSLYSSSENSLRRGIYFGLMISALFVSYLAFTESAKYQVPDIGAWILVEASVGITQFCLYGLLMSVIFRR